MDKRRCHADLGSDGCEKSRRLSLDGGASVGHEHLEQEKRVRREIANSNERRRMQSINAGFDSLRILLPPIQDGEKLSKATILQLTAEYINSLLNRVTLLENEVAIYRQSTGIQPTTVIPDFSVDLGLSKKRKSDDQKKRPGGVRCRRRRIDPEPAFDNSRPDLPHCSPISADTHQTSPCNSFNSSISISPPSPLPDCTSTTSARLEHLVMAIEQIEGGRALSGNGNESQDESLSAGDQSPPLSNEAYWSNAPEGYHSCLCPDIQSSTAKSVNSFPDVLMIPSSEIPITVPVNEAVSYPNHTTDYPVVTKLLNRPIPHKYLHRPQVVVNSTH
ncbi:Helix-loop-helix DNA-binding domain protein [Opisthorchis viverrini]|uniref:Helix-loop-helix DNA-binding domain protein n=1 Tax=Opisthorchis viverrini TaxID=6198 RepID=A0A1S8WME1_OPIVI|nr:Helix-loop-helix DNA-binding domain protein [Opisthorchis viverrini]